MAEKASSLKSSFMENTVYKYLGKMPIIGPIFRKEEESEALAVLIWETFKENKLAVFGLYIVIGLVFVAVFAPILAPYEPNAIDYSAIYQPPSARHLLGTDEIGRDVLSRIIYGARTSLLVGIVAVSISSSIGILLGAISAFYGGYVDEIIMRFTDILLTVPSIFLLIIVTSIFVHPSLTVIMMTIGLIAWPQMARIVRSEILSLKEMPFIDAEKAIGASDKLIIFKHLIPNAIGPIIVTATFGMADAILAEAGLSFLGLGDPTSVSWGRMLTAGHGVFYLAWWVSTFPGLAIFITILGFNLMGDGLRDALDPRLLRR
ncbi:MAG: ABC transporter permease [Candidatus Asgardarchaeia archaeon]